MSTIQNKVVYALEGVSGRVLTKPKCPSCGSSTYYRVDAKFPYLLLNCDICHLRFRHPRENATKMRRFYQSAYSQKGLTTELPTDAELNNLVETKFAGSQKDFNRVLALFGALGIPKESRVLDFGASWGYGSFQILAAGFDCTPFEISEPRASFGKKLGLEIHCDWAEVERRAPFDVAFSSHVLEHTPDPGDAISRQMNVLRPGGLLIALFPHGSPEFQKHDPSRFHKIWGRVHPVLLTKRYVSRVIGANASYIGGLTQDSLEFIRGWNQQESLTGDLQQSEMLVVCKKAT